MPTKFEGWDSCMICYFEGRKGHNNATGLLYCTITHIKKRSEVQCNGTQTKKQKHTELKAAEGGRN